jgi:hypothetical protein
MADETGQTQQHSHVEPCICSALASHILDVFGVKSEEARQHVRNARIEMLKAMRSMIDERIAHLASVKPKGTKITVE